MTSMIETSSLSSPCNFSSFNQSSEEVISTSSPALSRSRTRLMWMKIELRDLMMRANYLQQSWWNSAIKSSRFICI